MWRGRVTRAKAVRRTMLIAVCGVAVLFSGCSRGASSAELAQAKQAGAASQAQKESIKQAKDQAAAAQATADKKAADDKAAADKKAEGAAVRRDADGFALDGPPRAKAPANYSHPSHSDCLRFRDELRAWSNYQNQHRPPDSTNDLPSSGEVQYLYMYCHLNYY